MNRKMSKRQKDIKSKLMAAICMLLVSSIMMVSSTYAWFTLSTAPEVTGISTAVGANGNLEMALLPLDGDVASIQSGEADSMDVQAKTAANITWGNLVDVSDDYGLETMKLYPSSLNFQDDERTMINPAFPVSIPVYGADGRVSSLAENKAITGVYAPVNADEMAFLDTVDLDDGETGTGYGVRAIGTQSNASPALLAYKGALTNASSAANQAIIKARGILKSKGGMLADIAIAKMNAESDAADIYDDTDKENLQAMLTAVLGTEENPGSLLIIRDAMKEYMAAYHIATTAEYSAGVATIRSWTTLNPDDSLVPASMKATVTQLSGAISNAMDAQDALNNLIDGAYSWNDFSNVVNPIANPTHMTLNGIAINNLMAEASIGKLMEDVLASKGFTLSLTSGAGVFVDIADFCGNYSALVIIPEITHEKIPLEGNKITNLEATMTTSSEVEPTYLSQTDSVVRATNGPDSEGQTTAQPITDFYGYIIDLAFKTNVAGSNLELQTTAVDRIYTGNDKNEETMGGGSSMIFTTRDPEFMPDEMFKLLKHMKVILFDKADGTIYKYLTIPATIDSAIITGTDTINVPLYVADETGVPAMTADGTDFDGTITALDQNVAKQISVLVYLDGTNMTNADIASAVESMRGSLNLQFCSSAELTPMEYYDLRNGVDSSDAGDEDEEENDLTVTNYTVDGGTLTITPDTYTGGAAHSSGFVVAKIMNGAEEVTDGTVTINGEPATYSTERGGWYISGVETAPSSVTITVA